jgi:hypothetical protein
MFGNGLGPENLGPGTGYGRGAGRGFKCRQPGSGRFNCFETGFYQDEKTEKEYLNTLKTLTENRLKTISERLNTLSETK